MLAPLPLDTSDEAFIRAYNEHDVLTQCRIINALREDGKVFVSFTPKRPWYQKDHDQEETGEMR